MALTQCKKCGVWTRSMVCGACGAPVNDARKRLAPSAAGNITVGQGLFGLALLVLIVVVVVWSDQAPPGAHARADCTDFSPARQGWLLDHDLRGEVALWSRADQAFSEGNTIAAVVTFAGLPRGESMITNVTRQCYMPNGIAYYYVQFDADHAGWVDVDYLHWRKPTS